MCDTPTRIRTWVLTFGATYAVILFLTRWARENWSDEGILVLSAISGISGVSAITLSLSDAQGTDPLLAARGILLASATTTVVKCGFVLTLGAPRYRRWTVVGLAAMAATATAMAFLGW